MVFPYDPRRSNDPTQTTPVVLPGTFPEIIAIPQ
jgi:hypothetical protein